MHKDQYVNHNSENRTAEKDQQFKSIITKFQTLRWLWIYSLLLESTSKQQCKTRGTLYVGWIYISIIYALHVLFAHSLINNPAWSMQMPIERASYTFRLSWSRADRDVILHLNITPKLN